MRVVAFAISLLFSTLSAYAASYRCSDIAFTVRQQSEDFFVQSMQRWRETGAVTKIPVSDQKDVQRFVNQLDYRLAILDGKSPIDSYGQKAYKSWKNALEYIHSSFNSLEPSVATLKKIHSIALQEHYFRGYEYRRIEQSYKEGRLSQVERDALLERIFNNNEEVYFSHKDHTFLRGAFRSENLDNFVHTGNNRDGEGNRYLSSTEFDIFIRNSYMTINRERKIEWGDHDKVYTEFQYPPSHQVEKLVNEALIKMNQRLRNASADPLRITEIVNDLRGELISIHPFLDGNGRTIRLFCDLILLRKKLPPPLYFNENDLVVEQEVNLHILRLAMASYVYATE